MDAHPFRLLNMDVFWADKESVIPKGADDCAPFGRGREIHPRNPKNHAREEEQPRWKEILNADSPIFIALYTRPVFCYS